jgi:lipase chaperone LimK
MASLSDSKLGLGIACVVGASAGVIGVFFARDSGQPEPPAAPARTASWDGPAGPGMLAAASPGEGQSPAASGEQPLLDEAGRLKVDPSLRRVFDSFLKSGGPPREHELRAWLRRRLQQPALAQAENLAGNYLRYLQAEAALRANAHLAQPDPAGLSAFQTEQMLEWLQQRAQLRERMLGAAVSEAWFGAEDAACRTALADWRLARERAGSDEVDSNELRARRVHGAMPEQRRNERARSCAAQLMDRLTADGSAA